ncbi:MAG: hypothetical protein R3253_08280 [Longimicrobiales bacterium]|nr:hypothetical protein [Longimicrobiales bacterium]
MKHLRGAASLLMAGFLAACASTGSTWGSGVGDAYLEHPPFYAGRIPAAPTSTPLGYFPVAYQRGASQPEIFDPELSAELQALLDEMTAYVGTLDPRLMPLSVEETGGQTRTGLRPPDVIFGCPTESGLPDDDCAEREGEALGRGSQPMRLAVGRPSQEWVAWAAGRAAEAGVDHTLVLTLEVGQYWIRQRGLRGTKEVELGTQHTVRFPWLTALEDPVAVVQITGALVGPEGKAVRIGAEGLLARRTPMKVSVLGASSLVTDEDVAELRVTRREELAGEPLVWQQALRTLVSQLTGSQAAMHAAPATNGSALGGRAGSNLLESNRR